MQDDKYVVLHKTGWEALMRELKGAGWSEEGLMIFEGRVIPDAVVLRLQDQFAGPALHTYASTLQTSIELLGGLADLPRHVTIERLKKSRDFFHGAALEADRAVVTGKGKVPD